MANDTYVPGQYNGDLTLEGVQKYLEDELLAISRHFAETTALDLRPVYAEPTRPRSGMIVYADGTEWNPGAGEGVYTFKLDGTWSKL